MWSAACTREGVKEAAPAAPPSGAGAAHACCAAGEAYSSYHRQREVLLIAAPCSEDTRAVRLARPSVPWPLCTMRACQRRRLLLPACSACCLRALPGDGGPGLHAPRFVMRLAAGAPERSRPPPRARTTARLTAAPVPSPAPPFHVSGPYP